MNQNEQPRAEHAVQAQADEIERLHNELRASHDHAVYLRACMLQMKADHAMAIASLQKRPEGDIDATADSSTA